MIVPRKVGTAAGTTVLQLGAASKGESCIPYAYPVENGPWRPGAGSGLPPEVGLAPSKRHGISILNPYGSEADLRDHMLAGLGMIPIPYGYTPGIPAAEVVGTYTDSFGRRSCDPQHDESGEEGYYYDSQLGRAMPTDADLAIVTGGATVWGGSYTPVNSQWMTDNTGRMWPLPWMPPNGWDINAGRAGPQPTPPLSGFGNEVPSPTAPSPNDHRMFWIGAISAGAAVTIAAVSVWSVLSGRRR